MNPSKFVACVGIGIALAVAGICANFVFQTFMNINSMF